MATTNYLNLETGKRVQKTTIDVSAGAGDAGKIPSTGADGKIDESFIPNIDVQTFVSAENLTAGDLVYIDGSGEAAKATAATAGAEAVGFVKDSVTAPATVKVYFEGVNADQAGLTVGSRYYLDDAVAGGITATPPTSPSADFHQFVGKAISATELTFEPADCITLA